MCNSFRAKFENDVIGNQQQMGIPEKERLRKSYHNLLSICGRACPPVFPSFIISYPCSLLVEGYTLQNLGNIVAIRCCHIYIPKRESKLTTLCVKNIEHIMVKNNTE